MRSTRSSSLRASRRPATKEQIMRKRIALVAAIVGTAAVALVPASLAGGRQLFERKRGSTLRQGGRRIPRSERPAAGRCTSTDRLQRPRQRRRSGTRQRRHVHAERRHQHGSAEWRKPFTRQRDPTPLHQPRAVRLVPLAQGSGAGAASAAPAPGKAADAVHRHRPSRTRSSTTTPSAAHA